MVSDGERTIGMEAMAYTRQGAPGMEGLYFRARRQAYVRDYVPGGSRMSRWRWTRIAIGGA